MSTRRLIVRLDGKDLDGMASFLLVYELDDTIELVVTAEHGGDASVVLERAQATDLARALSSLSRT